MTTKYSMYNVSSILVKLATILAFLHACQLGIESPQVVLDINK
jgi:hypothetical protein